jgi:ATP-dependent helicase STH1/SNF2
VAEELRRAVALEAANEPFAYRRLKRPLLEMQLGGTDSKSERQRHVEQELRRKQKHREFLGTLLNHARGFKDFHYENRLRLRKLNKSLLAHKINLEKREAQRRERAEKERLRALKADDLDGYLKMLEETKNERLQLLLKQTDNYLETIGAMVQMEKDRNEVEDRSRREFGGGSAPQAAAASNVSAAPQQQSKYSSIRTRETYYRIAHTVNEEIKEQPDMLVGGKLKEYQLAGLQWLVSLYNNNLNGILADEMGLGKTIQTISLICHLIEKKSVSGPYLIVVPLSVLSNWTMEFEKWAPTVKMVAYKGQPGVRKHLYNSIIAHGKFSVLLTTYEYIMKDKNLLGKVKWNYVIIDEGHRMKNHSCKLSSIFSQYYNSRHRLLLTGTPLQNSLPELWSLLNFLLPTIFNSVENFEQWFNAPFAAAGEKAEINEEEYLLIINRLHQVLRPFLLRRLKSEVESQLPDKVEKVLKCQMSAPQRRMYNHMKNDGVLMTKSDSTSGSKPAVKSLMNMMMQLRKICNHPFLFEESYQADDSIVRSSGKFAMLDRILPKLKAGGHRVLIFSQMTHLMTVMEDYFLWRGFKYLRLDGGTKAEDRGELLERFNAPDSPYFIFMLSTRAGGLGLNLQSADTVILFDSDWNPQMDLQAQDRAHRLGQVAEVRVFRLICTDSVEEKILARANYKLGLDAKIIQAGKFNNTSSQEERRMMLEALLSKNNANSDDEEDEFASLSLEQQDAVINSMISRNEKELALFEEYDQQRAVQELEAAKAAGLPQPKSRLMLEAEIPPWMVSMESVVAERRSAQLSDLLGHGRGKRDRPQVDYDDNMTEDQFAKLVDKAELDQLPVGRRMRTAAVARPAEDSAEASAAEELESESEDGSPAAKKVRRTSSAKRSGKVQAGDAVTSEPQPAEVSAPAPTATGIAAPAAASPDPQALTSRCETLLKAVREYTDDSGRLLAAVFVKLPTKRELPEYYQVVKEPMDLKRIGAKLAKGEYATLQALRADVELMFRNAQLFNAPGSLIHQDAAVLLEFFQRRCAESEPSSAAGAGGTTIKLKRKVA